MKKPKIKLDLVAIKKMVVEHGEKAVFGLAAVLVLWLLWGAVKRETLPPTMSQDKLKSAAQETTAHVQRSEYKDAVKPVDLKTTADKIEFTKYVLTRPFDPPLRESQRRRGTVTLLPVEELQAAAGYDTFASRDPADKGAPVGQARPAVPGPKPKRGNLGAGFGRGGRDDDMGGPAVGGVVAPGAKLESTPWAVVTGLVPVMKQLAEYEKAFASAQNYSPEHDVPKYLKLGEIERAEVTSDSLEGLAWEPLDIKLLGKAERRFAVGADICDPECFDANLARPVPALFGQTWDERILHRKIRPASAGVGGRPAAAPALDADDAPTNIDEEGAAQPNAAQPAEDDGWGDEPVAREESSGHRPPPGRAGVGDGGVRKMGGPRAGANAAANRTIYTKPYKLFRVFDYTVESGKKYRYRVRWRVVNPNSGIEERYLASAELAKDKSLLIPWSEPSPVVRIPFGIGVLAGPVLDRKVGGTRENPKAKVQLTTFHEESGLLVATDLDVFRGSVANKVEKKLEPADPMGNKRLLENVNFSTDAVVLDIRGGQPMSKKDDKLLEPVEVLVLDREGNLVVRSELDDAAAYARHADKDTKMSSEPGRASPSKPFGGSDEDLLRGPDGGKKPKPGGKKPEGAGRSPKAFGGAGRNNQ